MSQKEFSGISTIQCGRIDFYIPLKFETKYDFVGLCHKINACIDGDIEKHRDLIQEDAQDICENLNEDLLVEVKGELSLFQKVKKQIRDQRQKRRIKISRENMKNIVEIGVTDKSLQIKVLLEEIQAYSVIQIGNIHLKQMETQKGKEIF